MLNGSSQQRANSDGPFATRNGGKRAFKAVSRTPSLSGRSDSDRRNGPHYSSSSQMQPEQGQRRRTSRQITMAISAGIGHMAVRELGRGRVGLAPVKARASSTLPDSDPVCTVLADPVIRGRTRSNRRQHPPQEKPFPLDGVTHWSCAPSTLPAARKSAPFNHHVDSARRAAARAPRL